VGDFLALLQGLLQIGDSSEGMSLVAMNGQQAQNMDSEALGLFTTTEGEQSFAQFLALLQGSLAMQQKMIQSPQAQELSLGDLGDKTEMLAAINAFFSNQIPASNTADAALDASGVGALSDASKAQLLALLNRLMQQASKASVNAGLPPSLNSAPLNIESLLSLPASVQQSLVQWMNQKTAQVQSLADTPMQIADEQLDGASEQDASDWVASLDTRSTKNDLQNWLKSPSTLEVNKSAMFMSVNQPMQQAAEWNRAMVSRLQWMANEQINRAQISLNPQRLGPIEVFMQVRDGQVQVTLQAKHQETRKALAALSDSLKESFAEQGMELAAFSVSALPEMHAAEQDPGRAGRQVFESKLALQLTAQQAQNERLAFNAFV
jgi:flagellar hook-length control protein FliK